MSAAGFTRRTLYGSLAAVAVSVWAVLVLADAARERDGVARVDPEVASEVLDVRRGWLTHLAHLLTFLGSEAVVGGLAIVLLIALVAHRRMTAAVGLALAIAGSATMTVVVKVLVERHRPGPIDVLGPIDHSYSFPSGHTLNSAVLLGFAVYLLASGLPRSASRTGAMACCVALSVGIGLSRVYLGYHWTTDVVASWIIAGAWLAVVLTVMTALSSVVERRSVPRRDPSRQR